MFYLNNRELEISLILFIILIFICVIIGNLNLIAYGPIYKLMHAGI